MTALLLAEKTGFSVWLEKAGGFFTGFRGVYVAEILLLFLLMAYVSKTLKENDATRLMIAYWILIVGVGALCYCVDFLGATFYLYFLLILSAFMLIMFNVEIKKSLWDSHIDKEKLGEIVSMKDSVAGTDSAERCIGDIIRALQNMSKNNVGALIILSKGNLPKQVLQSGVRMDADISTQLIEGVFFPKAPLHDGAMIIRDGRICASGCFLPLSQNYTISKEMGTRHRAALGVSENSDAVVVVVSEETGTISIAEGGVIERNFTIPQLEKRLRHEILHKNEEGQRKQSSVKGLLRKVKK